MIETEKAYIAGIIDGEGCITIIRADQTKRSTRHKSPSYRLAVSIYNTNKSLIDWLAQRIDTHRYYTRQKSPNHKVLHILNLSAKSAFSFLFQIEPYIIAKTEQVKLALQLQLLLNTFRKEHQRTFPGKPLPQEEIDKRETIYLRMRELNQGYKWRHRDFYQSSLREQV